MTLIELVVACGILIVVIGGAIGAQAMATSMTENNGHLGARTAEYAVDKMELLLELTYVDAQRNTTVFPSINNGGSGLAVGGSSNPAAPVVGYSDYLDAAGNILCSVATPCTATPPAVRQAAFRPAGGRRPGRDATRRAPRRCRGTTRR